MSSKFYTLPGNSKQQNMSKNCLQVPFPKPSSRIINLIDRRKKSIGFMKVIQILHLSAKKQKKISLSINKPKDQFRHGSITPDGFYRF